MNLRNDFGGKKTFRRSNSSEELAMTTLLQKAREGRANALASRTANRSAMGADTDARTHFVAPRRGADVMFSSTRGHGVVSLPR